MGRLKGAEPLDVVAPVHDVRYPHRPALVDRLHGADRPGAGTGALVHVAGRLVVIENGLYEVKVGEEFTPPCPTRFATAGSTLMGGTSVFFIGCTGSGCA